MVKHINNSFCNVEKSLANKIPECEKLGFKFFLQN